MKPLFNPLCGTRNAGARSTGRGRATGKAAALMLAIPTVAAATASIATATGCRGSSARHDVAVVREHDRVVRDRVQLRLQDALGERERVARRRACAGAQRSEYASCTRCSLSMEARIGEPASSNRRFEALAA